MKAIIEVSGNKRLSSRFGQYQLLILAMVEDDDQSRWMDPLGDWNGAAACPKVIGGNWRS